MAALKCACPNCQQPVQIAQALPARIQCPRCQKVFTVSAPGNGNSAMMAANRIAPRAAAPPDSIRATPAAQPAAPVAVPSTVGSPRVGPAAAAKKGAGGISPLVWLLAGGAVVMAGLLLVVCCFFIFVAPSLFASRTSTKTTEESGSGPSVDYDQYDQQFRGASKSKTVKSDPAVEAAVKKGVAYLKQRLNGNDLLYYFNETNGPHVGAVALTGLTLLECDEPYDSQSIQKAVEIVHQQAPTLRFTYSVALSILFLDRLVDQKKLPADQKDRHRKLIQKLALQLIAGQHASGGWSYFCKTLTPVEEQQLLAQLKNNNFTPGNLLVSDTYLIPGRADYRDNSIGQFVLLGLWNARKHGVPVAPTLMLEEKCYREQQNRDGSWNYNKAVKTGRDATTCAGLIGLAVGWAIRDEMNNPADNKPAPAKDKNDKKKQVDITQDIAIKSALSFVASVLGKPANVPMDVQAKRHEHTDTMDVLYKKMYEAPTLQEKREIAKKLIPLDNDNLAKGIFFEADAWGDLYFLWSVERVAVIYGLEKFQGKDWYNWGKEIILKNQKPDGSWKERFPGVPDTCFALLFLRRANIVKDLTDKLRRLSAFLGIGRPGQRPPLPPREDA
jgi:hypothetical protein